MNPNSIQLGRAIAEERIAEARHRHLVKVVRRNESKGSNVFMQRIGQMLIAVGTNLNERSKPSRGFDLEESVTIQPVS